MPVFTNLILTRLNGLAEVLTGVVMRTTSFLTSSLSGVRLIAVFEAAKALLVLVAGFGILALIHHDVQAVAARLIGRLHLNAANRYPQIFIDAASRLTDARLWLLAALAMIYATVRAAEAYGLWNERRWAEWIAVLSGAIYLPVELYELRQHVTEIKIGALITNIVIVAFIGWRLRCQKGQSHGIASSTSERS